LSHIIFKFLELLKLSVITKMWMKNEKVWPLTVTQGQLKKNHLLKILFLNHFLKFIYLFNIKVIFKVIPNPTLFGYLFHFFTLLCCSSWSSNFFGQTSKFKMKLLKLLLFSFNGIMLVINMKICIEIHIQD
jgi:hypothetical protein